MLTGAHPLGLGTLLPLGGEGQDDGVVGLALVLQPEPGGDGLVVGQGEGPLDLVKKRLIVAFVDAQDLKGEPGKRT